MTESKSRNWSTKTLARQLAVYLQTADLDRTATLADLVESLKSAIVEEEVGVDLDIWKG